MPETVSPWQAFALGSTGCQPVHLGSLPRCVFPSCEPHLRYRIVAGKLPATAGWQPALPKAGNSSLRRSVFFIADHAFF